MDSSILSSFLSADFIFIVIRVAVPLLFAAMSSYVAAIAGIPNIAVEGGMIFGALLGVYFSAISGSAWVGLLAVIIVGLVIGGILAFFTMKMKASPIMIGIALNLFASDFSVWLLLVWTGTKGSTAGTLASKVLPTVNIPGLENIPVLGTILSGHYFLTYVCAVIAILLYILVYKTPFGLRMKACGLDEHAAESVGIKVNKVRLVAILMSGVLSALGGAYLSMGYMSFFVSNMTASRGWTGIAANSVGNGNFLIVVLTSMLFALAQAIVNRLSLTTLPSELVNTIPYFTVLFVLIFLAVKEYRRNKED